MKILKPNKAWFLGFGTGLILVSFSFASHYKMKPPTQSVFTDALYVETFLEKTFFSVFKENSQSRERFEAIAEQWLRFPEIFGGFCGELKNNICLPPSQSGFRSITKNSSTPVREAYRAQACREMFKAQSLLLTPELQLACNDNSHCLTKIKSIFYPPPLAKNVSIDILHKKLETPEQRVSFFALMVCLTNEWQIL